MKTFFKLIVFTTVSLYLISRVFPSIQFVDINTLLVTGLVLTILTVFVRPFLKILLLPVNIITFGLFAWIINILVIYLATLLVPGFKVGSISIPAIIVGPFMFPSFTLSTFWSLFLVSWLISIGNGILGWIL
ncbi:MAG TPA: phage holin family protein [Patescibacteria group bacterium]|nr:phage holin family protein [Patescibacteria group bacterium]